MTSAFRHHDTRPANVTSALFAQLIADWIHLNQLATSTIALRRWARAEPVLTGCRRPADVVDAVDQSPSPAEQDMILAALIRLSQSGHQLAGRILLQLLLPKLGKMALRTSGTSTDNVWSEDRRHVIVAEFWDVVASFPVQRRTRKVAANLALDTLHRVTNPRVARPETPVDPVDLPQAPPLRPAATPGELSSDADLVEVVGWAVDRHVISHADGQLLCRVYLPHPDQHGSSADRAAADLGLSPAAVRQRCSRARRHLVEAVRRDLQPMTDAQVA